MKKIVSALFFINLYLVAVSQEANIDVNNYPKLTIFTTDQDHKNMMDQLSIIKLRPGASGNESAPNHANYDESLANPCIELRDVLTSSTNGQKITTPDQWWKVRRQEIVSDIENEMYGKLPSQIPSVTWSVKLTERELVNRIPVQVKQLVGHVDNTAYPLINVDIQMILVTPLNVKGPVPVLMMYGRPTLPAPTQPNLEELEKLNSSFKDLWIKNDPSVKAIFDKYPAYQPITRLSPPNPFGPPKLDEDLTPQERLLAAGWGYCTIDPSSIQADNGAGLTRGIIGLVNNGQPRKPDDWGSLRAWSWGAARGLDYLESDSLVNANQVGIEGVSRYGKAALVTLAFESRFALGLIGSSGKGGAALHRRIFGEAVENLTGSGEYHWMAGNYLKYGTEEGRTGRRTGCNLATDAHELIALCAPKPTFISYGIPEKGDSKWLDQNGSYMATIAAGSAFKLLGVKDLGVTNNYKKEVMPPMLTDMLDGHLAWRQHDGGHTDAPNFKSFIPWATRLLK